MRELVAFNQDTNGIQKTDYDLVEIARSISAYVERELKDIDSVEVAQGLRAKTDSINTFLRKTIKDRQLKFQAAHELTLSRLKIQRWIGQWIKDNPDIYNGNSRKGNMLLPLREIGINKMDSSRWQLQAEVPESEFLQYAAEMFHDNEQLTESAIINWGKQIRRSRKNRRSGERSPEKVLPPTSHKDCLYHDEWTSLWHGDAEKLPFVQNDTIDLIVTSPPYNIGPKTGKGRILWGGVVYANHNDTMNESDYQKWQIAVLDNLWRVTRPGGSLFYNHKIRNRNGIALHPLEWILQSKWVVRQQIIWDRESTHNKEMSYFWPHDELIFWLTKGTDNVYLSSEGARMSTVWRFGFKTNSDHPAPFPKILPARCIRAASKEGDLVLDPFGGSMTTCRAAKELRRKSIGVDISKDYVVKYALNLTQGVLV